MKSFESFSAADVLARLHVGSSYESFPPEFIAFNPPVAMEIEIYC